MNQEDWDKQKQSNKSLADLTSLFYLRKADIENELTRDEAIAILREGADVSNYGDPVEWQREVHSDRIID